MTSTTRLKEYLRTLDEVSIIELLDLRTDDILDRFSDVIQERREFLESEMEIIPDTVEELNFEED